MRYDPNQRCQRYIIIGRRQTIKNHAGDDKIKLITEVFQQVQGTVKSGIVEYKCAYYREIVGGRGSDVGISNRTYFSIDRTAGEFIELAYEGNDGIDTNEILKFRTYKNQNFLNRDRCTSFHETLSVAVRSK